MPRIRRSKEAERDLIGIWLHIADADPAAADDVLDYLEATFANLSKTPSIGHVRHDLWPDARCFVAFKSGWRSRFLIFYRPTAEGIDIARVLEGHQNITAEWFQ